MNATEATVQTLTAEVRTLMLGSRQVTLSVARQLDVVPLEQLEVMGRINLSEKGRRIKDAWGNNDWLPPAHYVIGRAPDGTLALATYIRSRRQALDMVGEEGWPVHLAASRAPLIILAGLR
jgi:hypothetical protein